MADSVSTIAGLPFAILTLSLTACKPPAADDYIERIELAEARGAPLAPLDDPDVTGAVWAPVGGGERLLFGQPGKTPLLALECGGSGETGTIELTRYARADPQSQALMALIGNRRIARLPVDAQWNGKAWLWVGSYPADDTGLKVFAGEGEIEATVPGAGSLMLSGSALPELLIGNCAETARAAISPPMALPDDFAPTGQE